MRQKVPKARNAVSIIFIDGAGRRPDGTGSGYAWLNRATGRQQVKWEDGLTNNQAEFRALLYALETRPMGTEVKIHSDSQLLVAQFQKDWTVKNPELEDLLLQAREIIRERHLTVTLSWVPRDRNPAGKLLERRPLTARDDLKYEEE